MISDQWSSLLRQTLNVEVFLHIVKSLQTTQLKTNQKTSWFQSNLAVYLWGMHSIHVMCSVILSANIHCFSFQLTRLASISSQPNPEQSPIFSIIIFTILIGKLGLGYRMLAKRHACCTSPSCCRNQLTCISTWRILSFHYWLKGWYSQKCTPPWSLTKLKKDAFCMLNLNSSRPLSQ